jgi:hypothetical protein
MRSFDKPQPFHVISCSCPLPASFLPLPEIRIASFFPFWRDKSSRGPTSMSPGPFHVASTSRRRTLRAAAPPRFPLCPPRPRLVLPTERPASRPPDRPPRGCDELLLLRLAAAPCWRLPFRAFALAVDPRPRPLAAAPFVPPWAVAGRCAPGEPQVFLLQLSASIVNESAPCAAALPNADSKVNTILPDAK